MSLASRLLEPKLRGVDLQGYERIALHAEILAGKPLIRAVFREFYSTCVRLDRKHFGTVTGDRIELGAGTSFFKTEYPDIISTDVQPAPNLDRVINAEAMSLESVSVRAFYAINCFHHFPHPEHFFNELLRTLKPGGGCVLIEPYFGFIAGHLYKRLFSSEAYDRETADWTYCHEPISGKERPNQALSYLVFFRDRSRFESRFPSLKIVYTGVLCNYLRYLLSGGLNFRQLVPSSAGCALHLAERLLFPLAPTMGLHHAVVLRKNSL